MALAELLARAVPRPNQLAPNDAGAAIALSLHCLLVEAGFIPLDSRGRPAVGSRRPPSDWLSKTPEQWIIQYCRRGAANTFRLHCSLQERTSRLFVHATEVAEGGVLLRDNIQIMGVQAENYVPDPARLRQATWDGVIAHEQTLVSMFAEYVSGPLWNMAQKLPDENALPLGLLSPLQRAWLALGGGRSAALPLAAAAATAAVAAGGLLLARRRGWTPPAWLAVQ